MLAALFYLPMLLFLTADYADFSDFTSCHQGTKIPRL